MLALVGAGLILTLRSDLPFLRNPVRRVSAKIVRHDRRSEDGATLYKPVFRFPDEKGVFIEVRDKVYTPFPTPVIGEMVEVIHPRGFPKQARIPYLAFRVLLYGALGYAFAVLVIEITGWW